MERKSDFNFEDINTLKKALKKAEEDIVLLKKENKKYWDENLKLQQQLQYIKNTRKYKYAEYLGDIYKNPVRILSYSGKLICLITDKCKRKVFYQMKRLKNKVSSSEINIKNLNSKNINIFDHISEKKADIIKVTIVICVHNALDDVKECIYSLIKNRSFPYQIIIIDDGSDNSTKRFLLELSDLDYIKYIKNDGLNGYTRAANIGLKESDSDFIVLLNSDTVVTQGFIEKMLVCFEKHRETGIVSPLSNAASYQSVPVIRDVDTGEWKINELHEGLNIEMMGLCVELESTGEFPEVRCVNGFCMMIKKEVFDQIGYLDEAEFPIGYGEEVDFCIRAYNAGFKLRIAENVYIYHKKTKSFKLKDRNKLVCQSADKLRIKYNDVYDETVMEMESCQELDEIRKNIVQKLDDYIKICEKMRGKKIAFLVTAPGGSGGVNSICQEVIGMRTLGIDAHIFNSIDYQEQFDLNYPELNYYTHYFKIESKKGLFKLCEGFDLLIATIFTTMQFLKQVSNVFPKIKLGYYVQDYEPYFFNEGEKNYQEAMESYNLLDNVCLFAKTKWIADMVEKNNGVTVELVEPSIDTKIYNAYVIKEKFVSENVCITAMIRPKTERRNPKGTLELFGLLKERYKDKAKIMIFGCTDQELETYSDILVYDYYNYGILKRWEVAELLAESDIFVDLSTYQAFGRTGLESMCLGCIPVVPQCGGTDKYAIDKRNALVVDTNEIVEVYHRMCEIIDDIQLRRNMQKEALLTGKEYSVRKAAFSEIKVINKLF